MSSAYPEKAFCLTGRELFSRNSAQRKCKNPREGGLSLPFRAKECYNEEAALQPKPTDKGANHDETPDESAADALSAHPLSGRARAGGHPEADSDD